MVLGIRTEDERRRALVAQRNALARQADPAAELTPFRSGLSRVGAAIQNIPAHLLGTPRAETEFSPFGGTEAQQDELGPLREAALGARSSEEFASIIQRPDLFPDPAAPEGPILRETGQSTLRRKPGGGFEVELPSEASQRRSSDISILGVDAAGEPVVKIPSEEFETPFNVPRGAVAIDRATGGEIARGQLGESTAFGGVERPPNLDLFTPQSAQDFLKSGTSTATRDRSLLVFREGKAQGARAVQPVNLENATAASREIFKETRDPFDLVPKKVSKIKDIDAGAFTPESLQQFELTGDFSSLTAKDDFNPSDFTVESWVRFVAGGRKNSKVLVPRPPEAESTLETDKFVATQEERLRNAFRSDAKPFRNVADKLRTFVGAFRHSSTGVGGIAPDLLSLIESMPRSAELPSSPMSDVAMIFAFMKILDPESVVREGEQRTIANAKALDERIGRALARAMSGETMDPNQRADMLRTMQSLFSAKFQGYESIQTSYRELAQRNGLNPDNVVIDAFADIRKFVTPGGPDVQPLQPGEISDQELEAVAASLGFDPNTQDPAQLDAIFDEALRGR